MWKSLNTIQLYRWWCPALQYISRSSSTLEQQHNVSQSVCSSVWPVPAACGALIHRKHQQRLVSGMQHLRPAPEGRRAEGRGHGGIQAL